MTRKDVLWISEIVFIFVLTICIFFFKMESVALDSEIDTIVTTTTLVEKTQDVEDLRSELTTFYSLEEVNNFLTSSVIEENATEKLTGTKKNKTLDISKKNCEHKNKKFVFTQKATCSAEGIKKEYCLDCKENTDMIFTPKLTHNWTKL